MTAKEYLQQLKEMDNLINTYAEEIIRAEQIGMSTTAKLRDVPSRSGDNSDKVAETAVCTVDLENSMAIQIRNLILIKKRANEILQKVLPLQFRTVLMKYYFQNKTLEQTADEMSISYQWACELHNRALREFEKYMMSA